jgi:hypothetical protein
MSAQPVFAFTARDAKSARVSYQHIAGTVNRILNRIVNSLPEEKAGAFKPSVFQTIHGLHGFFNGREVSKKKPVIKAHKFVAPHFEYRGDLDSSNVSRFMDRRLDSLHEAEIACGRRFVTLSRADGRTLLWTSYEGHPLLDAAEWVYLMARSKPDYWKNPALAISDDLLDAAIAKLPEYTPAVKPQPDKAKLNTLEETLDEFIKESWAAGDKVSRDDAIAILGNRDSDYFLLSEHSDAGDLMAASVVKGMWTKVHSGVERTLEKEFDTGGDPEMAARVHAAKIINMGVAIKKRRALELLRAAQNPVDLEDDDAEDAETGSVHSGRTVFPPNREAFDPTLDKYVYANDEAVLQTKDVTDTENPPVPLQYALEFIKNTLSVLPLWGVCDGICDCSQGSECRSAGKHPHSSLARKRAGDKWLKGVYAATTDEATVRGWFKKDPRINIGLAMGGPLNLICVDVDPRNDGDATYCDLVEAHGDDAFPKTYVQKTGGDGWHRVYKSTHDIKPGSLKAELGPGVDIKGAGGFIVGAGSTHASGKMYQVESNDLIEFAPEWMENEIVKALSGEKPKIVIDFQAHRDRKRTGVSGSAIVEGERNKRLFKIGCALWGKGEVMSHGHLLSELTDINMEKVTPMLDDSEVVKIAKSISGSYPLGVPITEGAA